MARTFFLGHPVFTSTLTQIKSDPNNIKTSNLNLLFVILFGGRYVEENNLKEN